MEAAAASASATMTPLASDGLRAWLVGPVAALALYACALLWMRAAWLRSARGHHDDDDHRASAALLPLLFSGFAGAALLASWMAPLLHALAPRGSALAEALAALMWMRDAAVSGAALQALAAAYLQSEAVGVFGALGPAARAAETAALVAGLSVLWAVAQWAVAALAGWPDGGGTVASLLRWVGALLMLWTAPLAFARNGPGRAAVLGGGVRRALAIVLCCAGVAGAAAYVSQSLAVLLQLAFNSAAVVGLLRFGIADVPSLPRLCITSLLCMLGAGGLAWDPPLSYPLSLYSVMVVSMVYYLAMRGVLMRDSD